MPKQTKEQKQSNYVTTVRDTENKAIAASIFRGRSPDGLAYLYYQLSRSFQTQTGKQGYSSKFFGHHADAVARVAKRAEDWIAEHPQAADANFAEAPATEQ